MCVSKKVQMKKTTAAAQKQEREAGADEEFRGKPKRSLLKKTHFCSVGKPRKMLKITATVSGNSVKHG